MATPMSSHRQILRATSIIASSSVANLLIGLVKTKAAALILGPVGIGQIGLLINLLTTAATFAGLGVSMAAVRQIAATKGSANARVALFWQSIALGAVGGMVVYALRLPLAQFVLNSAESASAVGWLGLAVAMTVVSAAQLALLNGLRRLGDLARAQILGAVVGAVLGLCALWIWRSDGMTAFVISGPLGMMLGGFLFTMRLPSPFRGVEWRQVGRDMLAMIRLGIPLMLGGLVAPLGLLSVRALVVDHLGPVRLGEFTAAWTISVTYLAVVLQAMGSEYFPRLSEKIGDVAATRTHVDRQTEISLLLALPILLAMQAAAPLVLNLLYSSQFTAGSAMLRWLIVADVLKLASWPMAFLILAQGRGVTFMLLEIATAAILPAITWVLIGQYGIFGIGIAYFVMYGFYLIATLSFAWSSIGFPWGKTSIQLVCWGVVMTTLTGLSASYSGILGSAVAVMATAVVAVVAMRRFDLSIRSAWRRRAK